uniref:uncharacterized protein n=1 Tax=Myxine glutinosa TaxID=7769 RepID=UPI00358F43DD
MRLFKKTSQRREQNMNKCTCSNEDGVNHPIPSIPTKPNLWKRLKQKFATQKKNKCCSDIAHDVEPKINKSLPSKTKKIGLLKRLKQKFTTHKKSKCCGHIAHDVKAEPLANVSVDEELPTESSLPHGEDDKSTFSISIEDEEYDVGQVVFGKWEIISRIGEGRAGFVYKAKNVNSSKEVALKKAKSFYATYEFCCEISMLKELNHPNIIKLIDILIKDLSRHRVGLVLEYVEAGSIASQIHFLRSIPDRELWIPMKQMADAFKYLHSRNIVHRDIKTENVLLCSNTGFVKIINFNIATPFIHGKKLYDVCGTPAYMAPEMTEHGYEGPPVDVWALGILFMTLFVGLQFVGPNIIEMSSDKTDFKVGNSPPTLARETLVSLLTAMLRKHPLQRLTMMEIVNHTFFKENYRVDFFRNAEPQVTNGSVGGPLTESTLLHGEDDESTFRIEDDRDVGQVVFRKWEVISKIGEGRTGFIYKIKNVNSSEEVALKKGKSVHASLGLWHEASIMENLNHPNIMKLIDILTTDPYNHRVGLIMEYVEAGEVSYTENVLYSNKGIVKVIDFGSSTLFIHRQKLYDVCGTPSCRAPEMTEHGYEGPPVDVWALGILFMTLFGGLQFDGRNIIEMSYDKADFKVGNSPPTLARETLVSLLTAMLRKRPLQRLTMTEIGNHTWFKEYKPVEFLRNAEPQVANGSVEEPLTESSLHDEDDEVAVSPNFQGFSFPHGEHDENTFRIEDEEFNVGQVVFGKWEVISKIGEGRNGFGYKVKNVNSSEELPAQVRVALASTTIANPRDLAREADKIDSAMKLIDILTTDPYNHRVGLILEYVEAASLASQIHFLTNLPEEELWLPMKQMADAFEYLHSRNIVHRDIKVTNYTSAGRDTFCVILQ